MEIDNILLLRTIILFLPFIGVGLYFHYKVKDEFFLKPRTYIQLNIMMICLIISFVLMVYWHLSLREYTFLGFGMNGKTGDSNTVLVLLGTLAAVLGWLFTSRGQALNATRSHSIQTLMASRLSEAYAKKVEIATEVFVTYKKEYGEAAVLSIDSFKALNLEQKNSIFYLLNYLEFIAVGIRFGDLEEKLMKNSLNSIIKTNYNFFHCIIEDKQKTSPSVYEHLTALKNRWECK